MQIFYCEKCSFLHKNACWLAYVKKKQYLCSQFGAKALNGYIAK